MTKKDFASVFALYKGHMEKYEIWFKYTQPELGQLLLPRDKTVYTLVVENDDKKVTDFISFYCLPSSILKGDHGHKSMNVSFPSF